MFNVDSTLHDELYRHINRRHQASFKKAAMKKSYNRDDQKQIMKTTIGTFVDDILNRINGEQPDQDVVMSEDDDDGDDSTFEQPDQEAVMNEDDDDGDDSTFEQPSCGELPEEKKISQEMKMLVSSSVAKSYKYGPCVWRNRSYMDPSGITTRWEQLSELRQKTYTFYATNLVQSVGKSYMQTALDSHYAQLYKNDLNVLDKIVSKNMKTRVLQDYNFGIDIASVGIEVPEGARALLQSSRKTVLELLGPFFNFYRSKIKVEGTKVNDFFFVDPIPLALLNLHHPEMLPLALDFKSKNPGQDPFLVSHNLSTRWNVRVGTTVDDIFKEHVRRAMMDSKYKGTVPLLIRIFLDGALVSNWTNLSLTPILIGLENLHPDIQVTIAAKTLVGYFPEISLNDGKKSDGGTLNQKCWHQIMGHVTRIFDSYHTNGGITCEIPGEYNADGSPRSYKFFPYICAFGEITL